ncbi:hypothetical protein BX600DRAFT_431002 [Xylariales sp. PMI_506]|nr:hypothetical protein BX600DRAFT_431002 [Xylariales sp. PMI_506]
MEVVSGLSTARPKDGQQSCQSQRGTLPQWPLIPIECRLQVLEAVAQNPGGRIESTIDEPTANTLQTKAHFAKYAAVCKEWQAFFEPRLYNYLAITQSCFDMFSEFVHRQRYLLKHIWLRIELGTYACPSCKDVKGMLQSCQDGNIVERAIWELFSIMSAWKMDQFPLPDRLTLEISMYSPSDSQHCFRGDLHLGPDSLGSKDIDSYKSRIHDRYHGWSFGRRQERPPLGAIFRLTQVIDAELSPTLPIVDFVSSFLLRRQTRRRLSPHTLQRILQSLPNLVNIDYEPWRGCLRVLDRQYPEDRNYRNAILVALPETLEVLTIFEDFNEDYNIVFCFDRSTQEWVFPLEYIRTPCPSVGAALAWRSTRLKNLSAAFVVVDADDFFQSTNLRSLSLTSRLLTARTPPVRINEMLMEAGAAALQMPYLETLEIWNGTKRSACVFRYRVAISQATLGWCSTFNLTVEPDILDIWRKVALSHSRHKLVILAHQSLAKEDITSHAAAIRALQLSEGVIHPESLDQITRE